MIHIIDDKIRITKSILESISERRQELIKSIDKLFYTDYTREIPEYKYRAALYYLHNKMPSEYEIISKSFKVTKSSSVTWPNLYYCNEDIYGNETGVPAILIGKIEHLYEAISYFKIFKYMVSNNNYTGSLSKLKDVVKPEQLIKLSKPVYQDRLFVLNIKELGIKDTFVLLPAPLIITF